MLEHFYLCPHCFTEVSLLIDQSIRKQNLIEDCERCCNPLEFEIEIDDEGNIARVSLRPAG